MNPHIAKGALPFPGLMLGAIAKKWGSSPKWWKRMVAAMVMIVFLAVLRGGEVIAVPQQGVTWVCGAVEMADPPLDMEVLTGVLLLLTSRKTSQSTPQFAAVMAGWVTEMLRAHVMFMRRRAPGNFFLFPARQRARSTVGGRTRWVPNPTKHISAQSFLFLIRLGLREACGLNSQQAKRFTLHSLRVGGMDHLSKMGVPIGVCAQLMSHKSIVTARRYLRLFAGERIAELDTMVTV